VPSSLKYGCIKNSLPFKRVIYHKQCKEHHGRARQDGLGE
jgi:hypothetical protein